MTRSFISWLLLHGEHRRGRLSRSEQGVLVVEDLTDPEAHLSVFVRVSQALHLGDVPMTTVLPGNVAIGRSGFWTSWLEAPAFHEDRQLPLGALVTDQAPVHLVRVTAEGVLGLRNLRLVWWPILPERRLRRRRSQVCRGASRFWTRVGRALRLEP